MIKRRKVEGSEATWKKFRQKCIEISESSQKVLGRLIKEFVEKK